MGETALRVAVLDDYQGIAPGVDWSPVGRPVVVTSLVEHVADPVELARRLAGHHVVVAMRERTRIDAGLLGALPDLELLVTTGPSNAVIDVAAAEALGVVVSGTGGYLTPTSELTWGLILALLRHIPAEDRAVRSGGWQHTLGTELAGRTLGLVGVGRVGSLVADVGRAFRMDVVGWSPNLTEERAADAGVERVDREVLFATADVVSIHLVYSDRTHHLIGRDEFAAMKSSAVLVNTSRGPIVDEEALIEALEQGRIAGAALDVFDEEPLPEDHPLRRMPNTVLTPHVGYVTDGLYDLFFREIVEDVAAHTAGNPIRVVPSRA